MDVQIQILLGTNKQILSHPHIQFLHPHAGRRALANLRLRLPARVVSRSTIPMRLDWDGTFKVFIGTMKAYEHHENEWMNISFPIRTNLKTQNPLVDDHVHRFFKWHKRCDPPNFSDTYIENHKFPSLNAPAI